jgi:hypothetical protein
MMCIATFGGHHCHEIMINGRENNKNRNCKGFANETWDRVTVSLLTKDGGIRMLSRNIDWSTQRSRI